MIAKKAWFMAVALALGGAMVTSGAPAAEPLKIGLQETDNLKSVLSQLVGKRVQLTLAGGGEMGGVVGAVNNEVLLLTEITGKDFYDAVVNLDLIAAVLVRTR